MAHKLTGRHSRGNPAISRASTAITSGKYTPGSYYATKGGSTHRTPLYSFTLHGSGKKARVPKSPPRLR